MTNSRGRRRGRGRAPIANDGSAFAAAFAVAAAAEPTLPNNVGVLPPTHAATTALLNAVVANNALPPIVGDGKCNKK